VTGVRVIQVGTWNNGINFTAPLSHASSAVVFANKTLRVTTILVRALYYHHSRMRTVMLSDACVCLCVWALLWIVKCLDNGTSSNAQRA